MNAINLYITIPDHHTVTLPAELLTGSQAQLIILTENASRVAQPLVFLERLKQRRAARKNRCPQDALDTHIQDSRDDWGN